MKEKDFAKLIEKYERGDCTPGEKILLESWFNHLSADGKWDGSEERLTRLEEISAVNIKKKISSKSKNDSLFNALKIAASVFLIITASFLIYRYAGKIRDITDPEVYTETIVPKGKRIQLTLSDGSTVLLNSASRIRYPENFNRDRRRVILLEGEALFDVVHDMKKPFIVDAGGIRTQVLGTSFNVRSYKLFKTVEVTVRRGRVAVKELQSSPGVSAAGLFLVPDQQVIYNRADGKLSKGNVNSAAITSWAEGKLYFEDESLGNVASILENTYNIHIMFKDETIKAKRIKASFDNTDSLDEILFAIARANKLTYTVNEKEICFRNRK